MGPASSNFWLQQLNETDSHLHVLGNRSPHPRLTPRLLAVILHVYCIALAGWLPAQVASSPPSASFTLSGTVVNSVTGSPIGRALVRTSGVAQRTVFSDSEGRFQIDGLPAGSVNIDVQKPGYFSMQQLRSGAMNEVVDLGPDTRPIVVKLVPQSAIYGRITDAAGQSIENVPVRLIEQSVRNGRQRWDTRSFTQSGEDGGFRFAGLLPATYYLSAGPGRDEVRLVVHDEKPKTGYPSVFYPGVPDLASASPIQLDSGQQAEADFSMAPVSVYHISGTVTGYDADKGVGFQIFDQSGEALPLPARFSPDTGTFDFEEIAAGSYILKASSQAGDQVLHAEMHVNVAANLDNVHLILGPPLSIPVVVRMESRDPSNLNRPGWNQQRPPVSVRLIPAEPFAREPSSTFVQQSRGNEVMALQDVETGKYSAEVMAWGPWYVQSAAYGPTNLLSDDLTVAPGQTYPIEIVLRDDGATLSGNLKSSEPELAILDCTGGSAARLQEGHQGRPTLLAERFYDEWNGAG